MIKHVVLVAALLAATVSAPASALLTGNPVAVTFLYPTIDTVEFGPVGLVPSDTLKHNGLIVSFADRTIDISLPGFGFGGGLSMADFNGILIHDIYGHIDPFIDVRPGAGNMVAAFDASRIGFGANDIWLNLQGLGFHVDDDLVVAINGGAGGVPEPASWMMLIAGFGLTGAAVRRRAAVRASA